MTIRIECLIIVVFAVTGLTGCQAAGLFRPAAPAAPAIFQTPPSANDLVSAIKRNTSAVNQLSSNVKVVMDGMPASATGTLMLERPERLRMKVGVLGMTDSGIDIGSNSQQFWIFNKSSLGGSRPTVYFANHDEYRRSAIQQSIQLRPQWLMDAMGLIQFDPAETIRGPVEKNGSLEIYTSLVTGTGTINRILTIDPRTAVVLQIAVYDENNRLLGWARSSKHRYFPEHNVSLPQHIDLHATGGNGQQMKLAVQIQSHTINSLYVDPAITWSMPQPQDVPMVDLTKIDPVMLQQSMSVPAQPASYGNDGASNAVPNSRRRPFRFGRLKGFDLRR